MGSGSSGSSPVSSLRPTDVAKLKLRPKIKNKERYYKLSVMKWLHIGKDERSRKELGDVEAQQCQNA